jgi:O-methyltransferase involved in polyketide biosynthesis
MKKKIQFTKEKETLLITLYAKARDSRLIRSVLEDTKAAEMQEQIDYDFSKFNSYGNDNIIVVRARQYDEWVRDFLKTSPDAIVLNLGCGLDTRVTRIRPSEKINWYDLDYPEVIGLRKNFYEETAHYKMISSSVTDTAWLSSIPNDRPALILAEGLLEYLKEEEVKELLNRLTDHFGHGQIMFDVMSSFAIQASKANLKETTGAVHQWEVNELEAVDALNPRLKRMEAISAFRSVYVKKLSLKFRLLYGSLSTMKQFRNMLRMLRYEF